jgi:6-pyruvoyltetrahydropterin/6-carboxytetrahydropterin synthase
VNILQGNHRLKNTHGHSFLASIYCALPPEFAEYKGGEIDTIKKRLSKQVEKLNYGFLNDHIEPPSDQNIALWINSHCYVPGTESVAIQSTLDGGLNIDNFGYAHIWRKYYFQAAHMLPNVKPGHKCGNMHGHGFAVILNTKYRIVDSNLELDSEKLDNIWAPVFELLDHACLNDIDGLNNPTSELLSQWIWNQMKPQLSALSFISVFETASCGAHYDGERFEIWKDFTLDSSAKFKHAPEGNNRKKLHGYTYTLRLNLTASIDQVMGWAIDFGDVKDVFNPIFKEVDHKPLWQNSDVEDCDVATLAKYIFIKTSALLPQLSRLELYETKGCGAICTKDLIGPFLPN